MHDYINFLIKRSDINKNEFYDYNPKKNKNNSSKNEIVYEKITEPNVSDYVVFDFETTGLSPQNDRIIEIGAVKVIDDKIVDEFSEIVDPEKIIPPFVASKVHITNEMIYGKRVIGEVLPDFVDFIGDLPLIAHNAKFDMSFLISNLKRLQGKIVENKVLDTLYLSRKYLDLPKNNLTYITQHFGIEHNNAHRALSDVLALYEVYKLIKEKANLKS